MNGNSRKIGASFELEINILGVLRWSSGNRVVNKFFLPKIWNIFNEQNSENFNLEKFDLE